MNTNNPLIAKQNLLVQLSSKYLDYDLTDVSYQILCDDLLELSGAAYAVINLLVPDKSATKTVAVSGLGKGMKQASSIFGFDLVGKEWAIDNFAIAAMRTNKLVNQGDVEEASPHISKKIGQLLKSVFGIGHIYSVGLFRKDVVLGTLVLIMGKGKKVEYPEVVEIFAQQVGSLLFRLHQEKLLDQERAKLEAVSVNSPDLLILVDSNLKVQFINKVLPGFDKATVIGDDVLNYVFPDYREAYRKWLEQAFQNKYPFTREVKAVGHHSIEAVYEVKFIPIDNTGKIEIVYIIASDITERKKNEETLERFRALLNASSEIILLSDPQDFGKIIDANQSALDILGYSRQELLTMRIADIEVEAPISTIEDWNKRVQELKSLNHSIVLEGQQRRKDGTTFPVEVTATIVTFSGKEFMLGVGRDITERKKTEQELKDREAQLRSFFNHAPDAIVITDFTGLIINWNPKAENIFGWVAQEVVGKYIHEIIIPESYREAHLQGMKRARSAGKELISSTRDVKALRKNGEQFDASISISTAFIKGTQYFIGFINDITTHKKAEKALKESERYLKETQAIANLGTYTMDIAALTWTSSEILDKIFGIDSTFVRTFENWGTILHPEWREIINYYFTQDVIGNKTRFDKEYKIIRINDKVERWLHGLGDLKYDDNGKPITMVGTIRDITERKEIEEKLKASEERLNLAFRGAGDGMWDWDITNNTVYYSPNWEIMFGFEVGTVAQTLETVSQQSHPEDLPKMFAEVNRYFNHEISTYSYEFRMFHRDGSLMWTLHRAVALCDKTGRAVRMIGTTTDITGRKKVEQALKESERLLNEAQRLAQIGSWSWIVETDEVQWSEELFNISGYNSQLPPPSFAAMAQLYTPESFDQLQQAVEAAVRVGTSYELELDMIRPDGHVCLTNTIGKAVKDESGRVVRLFGTVQDITERKLAEKELREITDRLSLACLASGIGIWELDIATNSLIWDDQMYRLYGITPDQFSGTYEAWTNGLHPDDRQKSEEELKMAMQQVKDFDTEFRVVWPDHTVHYIRAFAKARRDTSGQIVKLTGANYDITERKLAEQELVEAREKAESANRAKSEFLANMSHEIRTPMNAILGFSEILKERIKDSKLESYLGHIAHAGNTLLVLINDILDLSKIEAGKLRLEPIDINLKEFISEIQNMFELLREKKSLYFKLEIADNLPPFISIDAVRLRQILYNLLGNAFKFTAQGGITLSATPDINNTVIISVTDTGIGIPPDQLVEIFEAFHQQDGQSTRKYGGTGLGLTITRRLLELMGGKIQVQSQPGQGSTFTVTLPYEIAGPEVDASNALPEKQSSQRIHKKFTILIAEDDPTNLLMLSSVIQDFEGIRILEAENGEVAVRLAIEQKPDLIFMDLMMPIMDGYEANQRIKENPTTTNIPVIAWTASGLASDEKRIKKEFHSLLRKPSSVKEIQEILSRFMNA